MTHGTVGPDQVGVPGQRVGVDVADDDAGTSCDRICFLAVARVIRRVMNAGERFRLQHRVVGIRAAHLLSVGRRRRGRGRRLDSRGGHRRGRCRSPSERTMVPSGTTSLIPEAWRSACASDAGIVAATALRSERLRTCVAPTCPSWAISGACTEAAIAARAPRWARLPEGWRAGCQRQRSPPLAFRPRGRGSGPSSGEPERVGPTGSAVEPAAEPAPAIAIALTATAPTSAARLRGVLDILSHLRVLALCPR